MATMMHKGYKARIEFDEGSTSREHLSATVRKAGYEVDLAIGKTPAKGGCCN